MIRQAHTYLVSAMSGATLIAIAIVAFVLLVSAQVFRDWPIAALGDDEPSISDSRATSSPEQEPTTTTAAKPAAAAPQSTGSRSDNGGGKQGQTPTGDVTSTGGPTATTSPVESGDTGGGGDQGGGEAPSSSPAQSPVGSGSGAGQGSSSAGGGSKTGSSAATTPTAKVTETVNETVNKVDETVTGGALEKTGVTEVTEGVVNGVVGPESPVGKVVDGTVETVTGLLGGNK